MKKFIISEEEKSRILGMHQSATLSQYLIKEQDNSTQTTTPETPQKIDLNKIKQIFSSLGFKNSPSSGFKFHMDKPNNGPVKDRKGNYIESYEVYIPNKQDNGGFGYTDGKTPQLWVDKRSGLQQGMDIPNSYNLIFDLDPNNLLMQTVKNGKVMEKTKITIDDFYNKLQTYK